MGFEASRRCFQKRIAGMVLVKQFSAGVALGVLWSVLTYPKGYQDQGSRELHCGVLMEERGCRWSLFLGMSRAQARMSDIRNSAKAVKPLGSASYIAQPSTKKQFMWFVCLI